MDSLSAALRNVSHRVGAIVGLVLERRIPPATPVVCTAIRRADLRGGYCNSSPAGGDHAADDRERQHLFDFDSLLHPGTIG
jgi:hypothetical protein